MTRDERIERLLSQLRRQGVADERVLGRIATLPREAFVAADLAADAWDNTALPIAHGQTISQPYIVALMTSALRLTGAERVLEIGTGSGYQTAILAGLCAHVATVERIPDLAEGARETLRRLGILNAAVTLGDGGEGLPCQAPFDRILVTAGAPAVPQPLIDQLSPTGGILVAPVGDLRDQDLVEIVRHGARTTRRSLGPVRFVPLIGAGSWTPEDATGRDDR